jgi:hypothetical protein
MAGKNLSAFLTVDLAMNTTKFKRSIKGASENTQALLVALNKITVSAKKTGAALISVGKSVLALGTGAALAGIYALSRGASDSVKSFEDMRAKLSGVTGDLKTAEAVFWELNTLEDETAQSTQDLADALLYLNKFGVNATSSDLKNLSATALGLNKDLASVTTAIGKVAQGRYQALKELGIGVVEVGNSLQLSFKGATTEVEKSADAVKSYLSNLGKTQFSEVLAAKLNTVDAALGRFKNAWGSLQTEIFRSDGLIGQTFQKILNTGTEAVNGLITVFRLSGVQKAIKESAENIFKVFQMLYTQITGKTIDFKTSWAEIWLNLFNAVDEFLAKFKVFSTALIGAFKIIAGAVNDFLITPIMLGIKAIKKGLAELSDISVTDVVKRGIENSPSGRMFKMALNWAKGGFFQNEVETYKKTVDAVVSEYEKKGSALDAALKDNAAAMDQASKDYAKTLDEINKRNAELKDKLAKEAKEGGNTSVLDTLFGNITGTGTGSGTAAGAAGKLKSITNTLLNEWKSFYKSLTGEARNSLSERQRLELEYSEKTLELVKYRAVAGAEEIAEAKRLIDAAYHDKKKELELNAYQEYLSITGQETEILKLETEKRIELIRQLYTDELLTSQQFIEAQSQLITDYYKQAGAQRKKGGDHLLSEQNVERVTALKDATLSLADAFGDAAGAMSKGSAAYKTLFAIQKGFAVASATMNAILAWSQALSDPTNPSWIAKLAQYANAVALTANILGQLKSVQMYDKGGYIKPGELGIVGEVGPELVRGPAQVTGRKDTEALLKSSGTVTVNLYEDAERAGTAETSENNEETIINIFVSNIRRGGEVAGALESTYQLQRFGI